MGQPVLNTLLAPTTSEAFLRDYWENRFLHVARKSPEYFRDILTLEALDEYLSRNDLRYPSLRMIRAGKAVPLTDFSRPLKFGEYAADGLIDVDRVYEQYKAGASLVLQLMRSSISSVSGFANELQAEVRANVETTIYVTPPGEQGFTTHYDTHSVIILQIAGRKRWRLYDFTKRLPLLTETFDRASYSATPAVADIVLEPGDTLYVPRGLAHDATSMPDTKSVHVTVGLFPTMWRDMFEAHLRTLDDQVTFRHSPVSYFLPGAEAEFTAQKKEITKIAFPHVSPTGVLNRLARKDVTFQSRMTHGWMRQLDLVRNLQSGQKIRLRPAIVTHVERDDKTLTIFWYDKRISFPNHVAPAIDRFFSREACIIRQLQPNLDEKGSLVLARKLVTAGLAEIVAD
jgi:ribosomal protein L16 Arg81 hydroxylase